MKAPLALLVPAALASCATVPADSPSDRGLTYARLGQRVTVGGPRVTPLKVLEDSRCPVNVQCVWAGQVRLSVRIATGRGASVQEIVSNKPLPVADGTLTLVEVRPARRTDALFHPSQYRFGFRFDGGL